MARNFAKTEMIPRAVHHDRTGEYPMEVFKKGEWHIASQYQPLLSQGVFVWKVSSASHAWLSELHAADVEPKGAGSFTLPSTASRRLVGCDGSSYCMRAWKAPRSTGGVDSSSALFPSRVSGFTCLSACDAAPAASALRHLTVPLRLSLLPPVQRGSWAW